MHATAHAAGPARDEDGVPRIPAEHDHLVAAEQRRHGPRLDDPPFLQISHGVECQGAGHARDRIKIHVLDVAVAAQKLLDLVMGQRRIGARLNRPRGSERVRFAGAKTRLAMRVELDRKVLEAHEWCPP